jgi:xylan 1,4-beta-xylosidase
MMQIVMRIKSFFSRQRKRSQTLVFLPLVLAPILIQLTGCIAIYHNTETYRNPLLPKTQMADPHVIRVGEKYYLYATTHTRGYDVFVSSDLTHWKNRGRAFNDPQSGAWAPDVFHNKRGDGKFFMYYTDNQSAARLFTLEKQIGVAIADNPLGPFCNVRVLATNAIDAHMFQDDDGAFYLYYVNLSGGFKIVGQPMANPTTKKGEPKILIQPTEPWEKISGEVTEGPFMLKRNGIYYLMYSGTGADSPNYGIGYATSTSPLGPFTKFAENPIAHRERDVLGPGHHCVVEGSDGRLWMLYHQKWNADKSFSRFVAIDPLWFDERGVIHAKVSRDTDQPAPFVR